MRIPKHLHVKCPWCGNENTIKDWDNKTYEMCTNREMRRYYKHLTDDAAFKKKDKYYYTCPSCDRMSKGNSLKIVDTDNEYLKSLGGDLNIRVIDSCEDGHNDTNKDS